jgi:hypothetical protein
MPVLRYRQFLHLQCAISAIGLYPMTQVVTHHFAGALTRFQVAIYPQVAPFFYPDKKEQIFGYLLFLVSVGFYSLGSGFFAQRYAEDRPAGRVHQLLLALTASATAAVWFLPPIWCGIAWLCGSSLPVWAIEMSTARVLEQRRFDVGMVAASGFSLLAMTLQFCFAAPRIESEFLNVPTETRLRGVGNVSTGDYLLKDAFLGMTISDPQVSDALRYGRFPKVAVPMNQVLQGVIDDCRERNDSALVDAIQNGVDPADAASLNGGKRIHLENLVYEDGDLIATDEIMPDQEAALSAAVPEDERAGIAALALESRRRDALLKGHSYSQEEERFLLENLHQFTSQVLARRIIHHQNFLLGPINELELGRPAERVNSQYGFSMALLLQKILHLLGGVTYQAYMHLTYAFIPLYVLSAAALYWLISGSPLYAGLLLCLSVSALGLSGYDVMATAPGMNPLRHGLDMAGAVGRRIWLRIRVGPYQHAMRPLAGACAGGGVRRQVGDRWCRRIAPPAS